MLRPVDLSRYRRHRYRLRAAAIEVPDDHCGDLGRLVRARLTERERADAVPCGTYHRYAWVRAVLDQLDHADREGLRPLTPAVAPAAHSQHDDTIWISATQAAEMLDVSPQRVRILCGEDKLRARQDDRGTWQIDKRDVARRREELNQDDQ